jgi:hypothetical protein
MRTSNIFKRDGHSRAARLSQVMLLAIGAYSCSNVALGAQTSDAQTVIDNVIVYRVTLGRGGYGSTKLSGTEIGNSVDGNPVQHSNFPLWLKYPFSEYRRLE